MTAVVDDKEGVWRFMVLDEGAYPHHQVQMRVVGGNGEDVGVEAVFFAEGGVEVLELRQESRQKGHRSSSAGEGRGHSCSAATRVLCLGMPDLWTTGGEICW